MAQFGVAAAKGTDDVISLTLLPHLSAGEPNAQVGSSGGEGEQLRRITACQIEARDIDGDADELRLRLATLGAFWLDENHRFGAQSGCIQPVGAAIEIR
jgi:hypothetical protein